MATTLFVVAGVAGLFGSFVQVWLSAQVTTAQQLYGENKTLFDWSIVILGSSIPAVTGVLAILKAFYYAERNLPIRLQELLDHAARNHLSERPAMLAIACQPIERKDFLVPTIYSNPLARLGRMLGFSSQYFKVKDFACSVDVFADEIKALTAKKAEIENRKVTGHLIRGAYFSVQAAGLTAESPEWRKQVGLSLEEYKSALKIRDNDLDALEGTAAQLRALGNDTEELKILTKLESAAEHLDKPVQQAKALREIATIHNRRTTAREWDLARTQLIRAKELLRHRLVFGRPEVIEMAFTELLFGEVQTKREKFSAARDALNYADELFATLNSREGEHGTALVKDARKRLDAAANDKEAPGV